MSLFRPSLTLLFALALSACAAAEAPTANTIAAWGDSLTLGFGTPAPDDYPSLASAQFTPRRTVENHGIGGQTSTQIAARMGALPVLAAVAGDAIPTSGAAHLTAVSPDIVLDTAFGRATVEGTLCGVHGTVAAKPQRWSFTRTAAGAATPCPPGSVFTPDVSAATHAGTVWLWLGRNGADPGHTIEADIAAAVAALGHDRYLVAPVLTAGTDNDATLASIAAINANLKSTYGARYVDVLADLLAAGNASPEDTADTARGIVPRSLRWDFVHLTPRGNEIVANAFARATKRLGF